MSFLPFELGHNLSSTDFNLRIETYLFVALRLRAQLLYGFILCIN